ncbi:phosphomannomutase [Thiofaba sp. EF100]|uniref:phosphomannomutase n=1 Tax=Thiofaba sp. EF100 TaxID=3121274 RepID=UPI003221CF01
MNLACFKAYDIRGRVPDELNEDIAWRIGRAYADEIQPGKVIVGHDVRLESPMLSQALIQGLTEGGVDVIDIGLCGTEEVYFHTFHRQGQGVGGGIMITASHNPKGYNGMKLVREGARPISGDSGLFAIRDRAAKLPSPASGRGAGGEGACTQDHDKTPYIQHLLGYIDRDILKPLKIVADPGNGAAGPVVHLLAQHLPFEFVFIQDEPDGNFPNGVPNPLLPEMRAATAKAVVEHGADLGIAWDGDFDRCFFFDHTGRFIEGYYLVGLLAEVMLAKEPGGKIIHDPRLTWNTIDQVRKAGGIPIQSKTGHAFIKERMRQEDAIYGGEMSAHHYFRDFAYCDSGMIPWLLIAELISKTGKSLAELVDERMAAYPCSGEVNYRVENIETAIERVLQHYAPLHPVIDRTDGISLEFADWRFNLRGSNTEPLLRLNVETRGEAAAVARKVAEIESLLR